MSAVAAKAAYRPFGVTSVPKHGTVIRVLVPDLEETSCQALRHHMRARIVAHGLTPSEREQKACQSVIDVGMPRVLNFVTPQNREYA